MLVSFGSDAVPVRSDTQLSTGGFMRRRAFLLALHRIWAPDAHLIHQRRARILPGDEQGIRPLLGIVEVMLTP